MSAVERFGRFATALNFKDFLREQLLVNCWEAELIYGRYYSCLENNLNSSLECCPLWHYPRSECCHFWCNQKQTGDFSEMERRSRLKHVSENFLMDQK